MKARNIKIMLGALLATFALSSAFAAAADAAPQWKFDGTSLTGKEDILGAATSSSLKWSTMTTVCEHFLYNMTIENNGETGEGQINEVPLFGCGTSSANCTVNWVEKQGPAWPTHLMTVAGKPYLFIEDIFVVIEYGGSKCAVGEVEIPIEGTAGGLISNETETATFGPETFSATGAELISAGTPVEWKGVFPTEAFEWHREESLSVG